MHKRVQVFRTLLLAIAIVVTAQIAQGHGDPHPPGSTPPPGRVPDVPPDYLPPPEYPGKDEDRHEEPFPPEPRDDDGWEDTIPDNNESEGDRDEDAGEEDEDDGDSGPRMPDYV